GHALHRGAQCGDGSVALRRRKFATQVPCGRAAGRIAGPVKAAGEGTGMTAKLSEGERMARQLAFLREIDGLKAVLRQTVLTDKSRRENSAEHSWHLAVMAALLQEYANTPGLDVGRVIRMVLIHDIVEIDAGDTFAYDTAGHDDKAEREERAADRIFGL